MWWREWKNLEFGWYLNKALVTKWTSVSSKKSYGAIRGSIKFSGYPFYYFQRHCQKCHLRDQLHPKNTAGSRISSASSSISQTSSTATTCWRALRKRAGRRRWQWSRPMRTCGEPSRPFCRRASRQCGWAQTNLPLWQWGRLWQVRAAAHQALELIQSANTYS